MSDEKPDGAIAPSELCGVALTGCAQTEKEIWYLDKQTDYVIELPEVSNELKEYAVKLPLIYTQTLNGDEYQMADYSNSAIDYIKLNVGKSTILEKVFIADPDFFKPDTTYKFIFYLCSTDILINSMTESETSTGTSDKDRLKTYYLDFEFPVEVVKSN